MVFLVLMFGYYLSLLCQSPRREGKRMESLMEEFTEKTVKRVCFICRNRFPKRGYHCDTCGTCIEQYDHHCTWINNCVGKRNIARFVIFIVMLVVSLAFIGVLGGLAGYMLVWEDLGAFEEYFVLRYGRGEDEWLRYCMLFCFMVNVVTSLFFFPVVLLCIVQIKNLLTNKTTF